MSTILRKIGGFISSIGWKLVALGDSIELYNYPKDRCTVYNLYDNITVADLERGRDEGDDSEYDNDGNYIYE